MSSARPLGGRAAISADRVLHPGAVDFGQGLVVGRQAIGLLLDQMRVEQQLDQNMPEKPSRNPPSSGKAERSRAVISTFPR